MNERCSHLRARPACSFCQSDNFINLKDLNFKIPTNLRLPPGAL